MKAATASHETSSTAAANSPSATRPAKRTSSAPSDYSSVNITVLWQTVYTQAALDHLTATGHHIDPADVARLSPLAHPTINLQGRYRTTGPTPRGALRPLRTAT